MESTTRAMRAATYGVLWANGSSEAASQGDLKQQVRQALERIPGGEKLDRYFGISSGRPEQPGAEALKTDTILRHLRYGLRKADYPRILETIDALASCSEADPDALRELMRSARDDSMM